MAGAHETGASRPSSAPPDDPGDVASRAVQGLGEGLGERLVAVVLFGSRARGDASPHSDWDLLVIAERLPAHPLDRHLLVKRLVPADARGQVAMIAKTPDEFEAYLPSLYLDLAVDGRILHDPRGYATERLAMLRRIIAKAGLYRERTRAGDVWDWRDPPGSGWSLGWAD